MFLHQKNDIIFLLYPILFYNVLFCSVLFCSISYFYFNVNMSHTHYLFSSIFYWTTLKGMISHHIYIHMYIHSIYIIFLNETIRLFHYVLHYAIFS